MNLIDGSAILHIAYHCRCCVSSQAMHTRFYFEHEQRMRNNSRNGLTKNFSFSHCTRNRPTCVRFTFTAKAISLASSCSVREIHEKPIISNAMQPLNGMNHIHNVMGCFSDAVGFEDETNFYANSHEHLLVIRIFCAPFRRGYSNLFIVI